MVVYNQEIGSLTSSTRSEYAFIRWNTSPAEMVLRLKKCNIFYYIECSIYA
jgi:hypothetical protein